MQWGPCVTSLPSHPLATGQGYHNNPGTRGFFAANICWALEELSDILALNLFPWHLLEGIFSLDIRQSCESPVCSMTSSRASINLPRVFLESWKQSCHLLCCLCLLWYCESLSLSVYLQMHPLGEGGCVPKMLWWCRGRIRLWDGTALFSWGSQQLALSIAKLFWCSSFSKNNAPLLCMKDMGLLSQVSPWGKHPASLRSGMASRRGCSRRKPRL